MSTASRRSDVDVVILDLDGGPLLDACLASLASQTLLPSKVVVWDNGSALPVAGRLTLRQFPFAVEVHRSETNLGFTGGVNAAAAHSTAPCLMLLNNDVVLSPDCLTILVGELESRPRLGAVQALTLLPDGRIDGAGIDISDGTFRQALHGESAAAIGSAARPWGVSATATIYRRQALDAVAIGGAILDPALFAYYEDVELCARLAKKGWEVSLAPAARATHRASSSGSRLGARKLALQVRNRYIVARKHPGVGSVASLAWEDVRRFLRALAAFDFATCSVIAKSAIEGMRQC